MKLFEILNPKVTYTDLRGKEHDKNPPFGQDPHEVDKEYPLGYGAVYGAKDAEDDPESKRIKKQARRSLPMDDGFSVFIRYLYKFQMTENPHFPQIYKVNKIVDANGHIKYDWEIERLSPLSTLTLEENELLKDKYFHEEYIQSDRTGESPFISMIVYDLTEGGNYNRDAVKDKIFLQALETLRFINRLGDVIYDINSQNMMLRRKDGDIDLVFTDPFV